MIPFSSNEDQSVRKSQFLKFVLLKSDRKPKEKIVLYGKCWVAHPRCKTYAIYLKVILK